VLVIAHILRAQAGPSCATVGPSLDAAKSDTAPRKADAGCWQAPRNHCSPYPARFPPARRMHLHAVGAKVLKSRAALRRDSPSPSIRRCVARAPTGVWTSPADTIVVDAAVDAGKESIQLVSWLCRGVHHRRPDGHGLSIRPGAIGDDQASIVVVKSPGKVEVRGRARS